MESLIIGIAGGSGKSTFTNRTTIITADRMESLLSSV